MVPESFGEEDIPSRNFVRWYDPVRDIWQEASVEILLTASFEATIRTLFALDLKTSVYINTEIYSGNGIVTSCKPVEKGYQAVIRLDCEEMLSPQLPQIDPGILSVDGFLTEEQEAKILESLSEELEGNDLEPEDSSSDTTSFAGKVRSAFSNVPRLMPATATRLQ